MGINNNEPDTELQERFLICLRHLGTMRKACEAAGVARKNVYARWMQDPEFAAKYRDAVKDANDRLEEFAIERATVGHRRMKFNVKTGEPYMIDGEVPCPRGTLKPDGTPVMVAGKVPYTEYEVSDSVMIRLLEATNPGKFASRQKVEVSVNDDRAFTAAAIAAKELGLSEVQTLAMLKAMGDEIRRLQGAPPAAGADQVPPVT